MTEFREEDSVQILEKKGLTSSILIENFFRDKKLHNRYVPEYEAAFRLLGEA